MTDLRALIHRMADELDHYRQLLTDDRRELHPLATEARAALAEPEPPSLKELNLKHLEVIERDGHYLPEIIADLRRAIESLPS